MPCLRFTHGGMFELTLTEPADLAALGGRWQALEARAEGSFFQSWNWVGCLAARRFPAPVLLEARADGELVGLALFNRRRRLGVERLWLGESGDAALDSVFVEHNGPLIARGHAAALGPVWLGAAVGAPLGATAPRFGRIVTLSGVDVPAGLGAEVNGLRLAIRMTRPAPVVDFDLVGGRGYLPGLSANARYQIRRSARLYAAAGPLAVRRAATPDEALADLDALAALHQASWVRRGRPGAFANPAFLAFHRSLIERSFADGQIDLLRVAAGDRPIGYLYNFRYRGVVSAYQSGFDYAGAGPHHKPGLTCHHLAIEMYAGQGIRRYDLLAGGDRYKLTLANAGATLHWVVATRRWSPWALLTLMRR
ncbi:MAG: GNAT family N-acetyltransferase [Rhodospirillales bacterium]|nr:GNAT family N-acetyltransferase [Rhodospirillales bacterium]MDE2198622.1 GNAT family N-acetyltransferase [Rhodospirillales bacterium]MDE2576726.1 GNAT family N-acetyltransferase [Rhodospirillales bacterium]